jgi:hypothetical protein
VGARGFEVGAYPRAACELFPLTFTFAIQDNDGTFIQLTRTRMPNGNSYDCLGKHLQADVLGNVASGVDR